MLTLAQPPFIFPDESSTHTRTPEQEVSSSEDSDWSHSDKPCVPYRKGYTITAMRHEPPEPFGPPYSTQLHHEHEDWKGLSQTDYVLSRPTIKGRTHADVRKCLVITSTIRTGMERGAQIVVVDRTMVAKIYDPLYYPDVDDYGSKQDVVSEADGDYSREAVAYEELRKSPEVAAVTPAFYGTWTMDVESYAKRSHDKKTKYVRAVRFILLERLRGDCMNDVDPDDLREPIRSMILKKALLADAVISNAGVKHRDVCPRNIMILGSNYDNPETPISAIQVEVKVFDFNIAVAVDHPRYKNRQYLRIEKQVKKDWPCKLSSPLITHYGRMGDFASEGWCSDEQWGAEIWLWQQFHDDERFIPVIWDPSDPRKRPVYQERLKAQRDVENSSDSGINMDVDKDEKESDPGQHNKEPPHELDI